MHDSTTHILTRLLDSSAAGDAAAREQLLEAVYGELRAIAASQMALERPGRTLQPTALVHEAWLRLMGGNGYNGDGAATGAASFANRRHFFAAAANAMRRIRIDDARRRSRLKRGGPGPGGAALPIGGSNGQPTMCWPHDGEAVCFDSDPADDLALDEALSRLEQERPDLAEIVRLRYFAGLSIDQTAELLGVTPRTIDNRWAMAKAWLKRELE